MNLNYNPWRDRERGEKKKKKKKIEFEFACHVRATVGDSGLCCCVCVTSFKC